MRCAACDHRWIADFDDEPMDEPSPPETPPPEAPPPETPPELPAPVALEAAVPEAAPPEPEPEAEPEPTRSAVLRTIVAVILGGALTIAAGALWVVRIDPAELPLFGAQLAALAPKPLPLELRFTARTTGLGDGDRLLEIAGTIRNSGAEAVDLPDLEARLATPSATVRRWRIAPPVARLGPGRSAAFTSTATDFPADATIVAIRPAR